MNLGEELRARGFRPWYERELLKGHAHLVATLFCAIGAFAAVEAAGTMPSLTAKLLNVGAVVLLCVAGGSSVRQYVMRLSRAEHVAKQAACPACGVHGRLSVADGSLGEQGTPVTCRACGHRWIIHD